MDWPELKGSVDIEFRTETVLQSAPTAPPHPPGYDVAQRHRLRREHTHEQYISRIRREIELQKETLDRILHPEGIEQRMKEFREKEKVLRAQREERIRERYDKTRRQHEEKLAKLSEAAVVPRPPRVRPLGYLPPVCDVQDAALRKLERAKSNELAVEQRKQVSHKHVVSATKRVVISILEAGVDKKGFVRTEATIVQQFARALLARRIIERLRVKSQSPVVLSLQQRRGPTNELLMELVRDVVQEAIDNAKIELTREYVAQYVQ